MKGKIPWLYGCCLFWGLAGCALLTPREEPLLKEYASLPLPHCSPEMDQAEYWIAQCKNPDHILLTTKEIEKLNRETYQANLLRDVFFQTLWDYPYLETDRSDEVNPDNAANPERDQVHGPGRVGGYTLYTYLKEETERIKRRERWNAAGQIVSPQEFQALEDNLNLLAIREDNPVRYGITCRRTNIRFYPTDQLMSSEKEDTAFDVLQVSAVRGQQPLAILHESRDKQWAFVVTAFCRGWIKRQAIAENCTLEELKPLLHPQRRLVVTGPVVEAVMDPGNTCVAERLYLGTSCPLVEQQGSYYKVSLPARGAEGQLGIRAAYIPVQADVQPGYLSCTPRNLYLKAFQLLHSPYTWGGKGEYRDCSQFLMDLYAAMGIELPRNSSSQVCVGNYKITLSNQQSLEQRSALLNKIQRPVMLQFPGHIMLFLGKDGGYYYIIHDIWSYRAPNADGKDKKIIVGQVVVSDLSLGEGSKQKTFLERLTTINYLKP